MKKILLVMFIVLSTAASVFCGEFEDKLKAAEQGDAAAQYSLGVIYEYGQGVTQDYKQAFYWLKKSAEQGYAKAQYNFGVAEIIIQISPKRTRCSAINWIRG